MDTRLSYDVNADVLYASLGSPVPCTSRDRGFGVIVRYEIMRGAVSAVTLIDAKHNAVHNRQDLLDRLAEVLHELRRAITLWLEDHDDRACNATCARIQS